MAGLEITGFVRKTVEEILAEIESEEKSLIDPNLNVQPETPIGQLNGIFASKLGELWELAEAVNSAQNPDDASGFALDGVSAITGTFRNPATKGTVTLEVDLDAATTVPAGSIVQVAGDPDNRWVTTEDVTSTTAGPYSVEAEAETAGNIAANSGTITVIVTPVAGWNSVTNPSDADPGTEIDTDAQLRARREIELSRAGSATVNAIRADLLNVVGVTSATVFDNPTDAFVGTLPPHSVECVVLGGTDDDVAQGLFDTVAAGILTFGTTTVAVTDDQGFDHGISFSRPTTVDIYLEIDVDVDDDYPVDGDDLIAAAVAAFGDANYDTGDDVILSHLNVPIYSVAGVVDVTEIRVGRAASPTSTVNEPIGSRELADLDTSRIVVTSTPI